MGLISLATAVLKGFTIVILVYAAQTYNFLLCPRVVQDSRIPRVASLALSSVVEVEGKVVDCHCTRHCDAGERPRDHLCPNAFATLVRVLRDICMCIVLVQYFGLVAVMSICASCSTSSH